MSFEEFVERRGQHLLRLAYVLCKDAGHAEDIVQTTLLKAFRSWRTVMRSDDPDAYVRRILVNAHLDWVRRRSNNEQPTNLFGLEEPVENDFSESIANRDAVRRHLSSIAPRARTVLVLRYYEELGDDEIADLMNINVATVRATHSRAINAMRSAPPSFSS